MRNLRRLNALTMRLLTRRETDNRCFHKCTRLMSSEDPFNVFLRQEVREMLNKLNESQATPETVLGGFMAKKWVTPEVKALTETELEEERKKGEKFLWRRRQLPPFMKCRESKEELLADNPEIASILSSKYVFIDISENSNRIQDNSERPVVCRHTDGRLTVADWETTDRITQMYMPVASREIHKPKMFEEQQLEILLKDKPVSYKYILERACVQFPPDSDDFIRVTQRVYEYLFETDQFEELIGTRFYGHMSFYLCWVGKIDRLIIDSLNRNRLDNAALLCRLDREVHGGEKFKDNFFSLQAHLHEFVKPQYKAEFTTALDNFTKNNPQESGQQMDKFAIN